MAAISNFTVASCSRSMQMRPGRIRARLGRTATVAVEVIARALNLRMGLEGLADLLAHPPPSLRPLARRHGQGTQLGARQDRYCRGDANAFAT